MTKRWNGDWKALERTVWVALTVTCIFVGLLCLALYLSVVL